MIPSEETLRDSKKLEQFKGATSRQRGEDKELFVSTRFEQMLKGIPQDGAPDQNSYLLLRNLSIESFKLDAIIACYPSLQNEIEGLKVKHVKKKKRVRLEFGETDIIVFIRNVGVVVGEVKSSMGNAAKGTKQARKITSLLKILFEYCAPGVALPVESVVFVCEDEPFQQLRTRERNISECSVTLDESYEPAVKRRKEETLHGAHILKMDSLQDETTFREEWNLILNSLDENGSINNMKSTPEQFDTFLFLMVGLWNMVTFEGCINYKGMYEFLDYKSPLQISIS